MLAPEISAQILSIRPEITRFIGARRRRRCIRTPDADDEVQEALTEIMHSVPHYRPELGAFRPWAFGIALNVHRRFARNRKRQHDCFAEQDINVDDHEAPNPSPERWLQIQEARRQLECANRDMPAAQYAALYLHVFEGHSHAEIAKELGITQPASKQLVHRARGYLAQRGLNEKTFFSAPPLFVEVHSLNDKQKAFWREMYDWSFRLVQVASLLAVMALAAPVKPLAVAKVCLNGFVREHIVVVDEPVLSLDKLAPVVETNPKSTQPVRNEPVVPHRRTAPSVKSRFQSKPYDLSLMVRKNP